MCSYPELTKDHVLTSAYVKIFRIVTRNAVNKSFWRKKDCSWPPLNKYAMNIWLSSLKIRAHLSWRTGKHLHVLHVLRTYSTCSCPGQQDTTTYAALIASGVVFGTQSSQLRCWKGLFYHFSLNKSLMGLTQSCGKNSDWFVTITQSCGKALIGWSQIRKSGDRIFDLSELCHRFE